MKPSSTRTASRRQAGKTGKAGRASRAFKVSSAVPEHLREQFRKDWEEGLAPVYVKEEADHTQDAWADAVTAKELGEAFVAIRREFQARRKAYCEARPEAQYAKLDETALAYIRQEIKDLVPVAVDVERAMPGIFWMLTCCEYTGEMNQHVKHILGLRAQIEAGELQGEAVLQELEVKNKQGLLGNTFESLPYRPGKFETTEGREVHVKDIRQALQAQAPPQQ